MSSNVISIEDFRKRQIESTHQYLTEVTAFVTSNLSVHQEVVDRGTILLDILDELLCRPHIINEQKKETIESKLAEIFGTRHYRSRK